MSRSPYVPGINPTSHPPHHPLQSPLVRLLSPSREELRTPPCSPPSNPHTPVIVTNPSFLPPPPLFPRRSPFTPAPVIPPRPGIGSRLPTPSGRWDPLSNTPSYQRSNTDFWASRQFPIPILSTVSSQLSGLGFTPDSDSVSTEAFEEADPELDIEVLESERLDRVNMGVPDDPEIAAEAERLGEIR